MALVPMRTILDHACQNGYGIGAFNVNNMEQAQGAMAAAVETDSPLIYQISRGALNYSNKRILRAIIEVLIDSNPQIPVAVHLDHGNSPQICKEVIDDLNFTSVMMDGSLHEDGKTPSGYEYNMKVTKEVVDYAHKRGVTVEAEIGLLGGLEEGQGSGEGNLTRSEDLKRLYNDCRMDACAIGWGTKHGAYKGVAGQPPKLSHQTIVECHEAVPDVLLVSHGSSSLAQKLKDMVNEYGVIRKYVGEDGHQHISAYGQDFDLETANPKEVLKFLYESKRMPESVGVPTEDLQQAIKEGMVKINVDTDGRIAVTGTILSVLEKKPSEFDPRKYLGPARDEAIRGFVKDAMIAFGSAGQANKIEIVTLDQMARQYR